MKKPNMNVMIGAAIVAAMVGCDKLKVPEGTAKAELDLGGVTFDFKKISDKRFDFSYLPSDGMPGNLIPDDAEAAPLPANYQKWHEYICFNHATLPSDSQYRRDLHKHMTLKRDGKLFSIVKDEDLRTFCAPSEFSFLHCCAEGTWRKYIRLPDAKGGAYRFSLRYKMRHALPQRGLFGMVIIHSWKLSENGKDYVHVNRPGGITMEDVYSEWTPTYVDFDVPAGADIISIQIRHDGIGELIAKDVYLTHQPKAKSSESMTIELTPTQMMDGDFAISAGQPAHMTWRWRKNSADAFDSKDSELRLTLSKGFEFLGDTFASEVKVTKNADGSSVVTFKWLDNRVVPSTKMLDYNFPATLIRSTGVAGTEGKCSLSAWRNGKKTGDSGAIRLITVPTIKATSPARYLYAAMPGASQTINFNQPEACAAMAHFLADVGVRQVSCEGSGWHMSKHAETYKREFRAAGVRRLTPCSNKIANSYFIGNHNDVPEADKFVSDETDGMWVSYVKQSICPQVVIEERPYFIEKTLPMLREELKGCDGLRANWEPFMFVHHGCYCEKCRAEFAKWAKLSVDELKANWPKLVKEESKYGKQWIRFRSLQHAKLVKIINRHIMSMTGGKDSFGLIPAITWREMNSTWPKLHPSPESEPIDYAADIETMGTWGPYVIWDVAKPYFYQKRAPLVHFVAAKDVREQTDRDFPEGKRPRLLGGTQGLQCGTWVCQPEWLEMALDCYFFNGFQGTQAYYFPEGLDARHCEAYARSAGRAAKAEHAVWDGKRNDDAIELKVVAEYAKPSTSVTAYMPDYRDMSMLQKVVYDVDDKRLVAVFNFWEKGAAFFDMKVKGLKAGEYVVVDEQGVLYAKDAKCAAWTADELAAGISLEVGAARTRFFEIRPANEGTIKDVKAAITQAGVREAYNAALPKLREEAAKDAVYEAVEGGKMSKDTKAEI